MYKKHYLFLLLAVFASLLIYLLFRSTTLHDNKNNSKTSQKAEAKQFFDFTIRGIDGNFEINDGKSRKISSKKQISKETKIKTGDTKAEIKFSNKTVLRLNKNTEIEFKNLKQNSAEIFVKSGEVYSRLDKNFSINFEFEDFSTDQKNGVCHIILGKSSNIVKTYKNSCGVELKNKFSETADFKEKIKIIGSKTLKEDITKDELENDEFAQWNKIQDENNPEFKNDLGIFTDIKPPILEIISPKDGENVSSTITFITGKAEPNIKVRVGGFGNYADDNGNFSVSYLIRTGENKVKIVAEDENGNKTTKEITIFGINEQAEEN